MSAQGARRGPLSKHMHHHAFADDEITRVMSFNEYQGFSMEDSHDFAKRAMSQVREKPPREVLQDLQKGNTRFWMGISERPELSAFERRALIVQQFPTVAVLGCSDSRVPVELVFDCALGDMFVVRIAGNTLRISTLASLEYAVKHLEVKVIIIMGHEGCGAIKAASQSLEKILDEPDNLREVLKDLKVALNEVSYSVIKDSRARDREMATNNVRWQIDTLRKDDAIIDRVRSEKLIVVGAFYEISSGIVDFFYTLDAEHL